VTEETVKLFYSIGEVAEILNVNQSTLRFWEKEFPSIRPVTNKKGNRMYTKKEVDLIYKIYDLVKVKGFTLQGARDQLKRKKEPIAIVSSIPLNTSPDIRSALLNIRSSLIQLKNQI
jgi:DNA-binding transcriptional MerR regulator